ncbi:VgrG-related protein [Fundidesulfovibrio butyratiphilus]
MDNLTKFASALEQNTRNEAPAILRQDVLPLLSKIERNTAGIVSGVGQAVKDATKAAAKTQNAEARRASSRTARQSPAKAEKNQSSNAKAAMKDVADVVAGEVAKAVAKGTAASRKSAPKSASSPSTPTAPQAVAYRRGTKGWFVERKDSSQAEAKSATAMAERRDERAQELQRKGLLDVLKSAMGKPSVLKGGGDAKDAAALSAAGPIWGAIQEMGEFAGDAKDALDRVRGDKASPLAKAETTTTGLIRDAVGRFTRFADSGDKGVAVQEAVLEEQKKLVSQSQEARRADDKNTQEIKQAIAQGGGGGGGLLDTALDMAGGGKGGKVGKIGRMGRMGRFGRGAGSLLGSLFGVGEAGGAIGETVGNAIGAAGSKVGGWLGGASKIASRGLPVLGGLLSGGMEYALTGSVAKGVGSGVGSTVGAIAGGALGSVLGPAGTVGGAVLGGMAGDWLGSKAGGLVDALMGLTTAVEDSDKKHEREAKGSKPSGGFFDFLSNAWSGAKDTVGKGWEATKGAVGGAYDAAKGGAGKAWDATKEAGGAAWETVTRWTGLGDSTKKYESGSRGVSTVSNGQGDPGGVSYGTYQLASKTGTAAAFMRSKEAGAFSPQFAGLTPGTPEFSAKWKEVAAKDPEGLHKAEKAYLERTHFVLQAAKADSLGFDMSNPALRDAVWSGSIQHGRFGKVLEKAAAGKDLRSMSAEDQIKAMYDARSQYADSLGVTPAAGSGRYKREIQDVLALNSNFQEKKGASAEAVPAVQPLASGVDQRRADLNQKIADAEASGNTSRADAYRKIAAREGVDLNAKSTVEAKPVTPTELAMNATTRDAAVQRRIAQAEASGDTASADKWRAFSASKTANPEPKQAEATPAVDATAEAKGLAQDMKAAQAQFASFAGNMVDETPKSMAAMVGNMAQSVLAVSTMQKLTTPPSVADISPTFGTAMNNINIPGLSDLTAKLEKMAEGLGNFGKEKERDTESRETPAIPIEFDDSLLVLFSHDRL